MPLATHLPEYLSRWQPGGLHDQNLLCQFTAANPEGDYQFRFIQDDTIQSAGMLIGLSQSRLD
jgi:hypothetical protein